MGSGVGGVVGAVSPSKLISYMSIHSFTLLFLFLMGAAPRAHRPDGYWPSHASVCEGVAPAWECVNNRKNRPNLMTVNTIRLPNARGMAGNAVPHSPPRAPEEPERQRQEEFMLRPELYKRLSQRLGEVRIVNEDETMDAWVTTDVATGRP